MTAFSKTLDLPIFWEQLVGLQPYVTCQYFVWCGCAFFMNQQLQRTYFKSRIPKISCMAHITRIDCRITARVSMWIIDLQCTFDKHFYINQSFWLVIFELRYQNGQACCAHKAKGLMSNVIGSYIMIAICTTSHWVKIGRLGH